MNRNILLASAFVLFGSSALAVPVVLSPSNNLQLGTTAGTAMPGIVGNLDVTQTTTPAACNGTTDDTAAFNFARGLSQNLEFPRGRKTCVLSNFVLSSAQLDCNDGTISSGGLAGVAPAIEITGSYSGLHHCTVQDTNGNSYTTTTLASSATAGSNTITVTSATGFAVGNLITVKLDSGARFPTIITGISGTTITLEDTIPTSVNSATAATSGAGCLVNDVLEAVGGSGVPSTYLITNTTGPVVSVESPGLYFTAPSSTVNTFAANVNHCTTMPTLNLSMSTAAAGNTVVTGYGAIWVHNAFSPQLDFIHWNSVDFAVQIDGSTQNGHVEQLYGTASQIGFYLATQPDDMYIDHMDLWGPSTSNPAVVDYFGDGITGTQAGNAVSHTGAHGAEIEWYLRRNGGTRFVSDYGDDANFASWVDNGGTTDQFIGIRSTHTQGRGTTSGMGTGFVAINGTSDLITSWHTDNNAVDCHFESGTSMFLDGMWGPQRNCDILGPNGASFGGGLTIPSPSGVVDVAQNYRVNGYDLNQGPGGRLTLSSTSAIPSGNLINKSTIYYLSYIGHRFVPIRTSLGGTQLPIAGNIASMGLDATVPNIVAGNVYDIFMVDVGGVGVMCAGPSWTSTTGSTPRSVGLEQPYGFETNSSVLTTCYGGSAGLTNYGPIAQDLGTYLGSFYATANGQTGMNYQPTPAAGGSGPYMYLFNGYNRVRTCGISQDTTTAYTYSSATSPGWRAADGSNNNRVTWIDGLNQMTVNYSYLMSAKDANSTGPLIGVQENATSTTGPARLGTDSTATSGLSVEGAFTPAGLGINYIQAQDGVDSTGAGALFNTNGATGNQLTVCGDM